MADSCNFRPNLCEILHFFVRKNVVSYIYSYEFVYIYRMKRLAINDLIEWQANPARKPLIIRGARQVGKTWLMKEFGRTSYAKVAYLNFESSSHLKEIFNTDFDVRRIIRAFEIETNIEIDTDTLIILDEIQEAPAALTSLKYFFENAPQFHILAAGSLLGVAMHQHTSFPVGKVDFLDLYPLSFTEFLTAIGQHNLVELILSGDWNLITGFKAKYIDLLKHYYFIGGMPEAVLVYTNGGKLEAVRAIQKNILRSYEQDFSKHAPSEIVPRIRMLWNSIPAQLAKENRKFVYSHIKTGARAKEFEMALAWLVDAGLVHKVHRATKPSLPLKAYEDGSSFKLFMCDTGLLVATADIDPKTLLDGNSIFQEFKGAITEQYVLQQLITKKDLVTYYWSAPGGQAEIDFLLQVNGQIVPIEVKAEENLKAKSLQVFHQHFHLPLSIRTSMSDYKERGWITNVPLYGALAIDLVAKQKRASTANGNN